MKTLILTSQSGFEHRPPEGHPERPDRLRSVLDGLRDLEGLVFEEAGPAPREALERVHTRDHVDRIFALGGEAGVVPLDADTWMSAGSLEAARKACGAAIRGVDAVIDGEAEAVFSACRPPGHHAEPDRAMGFCLFNNIAVAAKHALDARGLERAAVIDIDVHHGNGTQAAAEIEPRMFFASIHQGWIYPGTGAAHETGRHGNIVNAPVESGTAGPSWRETLESVIFPPVIHFKPDILLVSAGFDSHADDPLAGLGLTGEDFAWAGACLAGLAREHAGSRLVCVLEGGYDFDALKASAREFVRALQTA